MTTRTLTGSLLLVLAAGAADCDGARPPTAPSTLPQQPPLGNPGPALSDTVPASNNGVVGVYRSDVTMSRGGTATVTLRWPNADFSLQLYVTTGTCAGPTSLIAGACTILGTTRPGTLPGAVTSPVTNGDLNTIWVLNTDPAPQSFTIDIEIR